jgi:hypothetical protein
MSVMFSFMLKMYNIKLQIVNLPVHEAMRLMSKQAILEVP